MDTVQLSIRGVPAEVAEHFKTRAAEEGKSLNAFIVGLLSDFASRELSQKRLLAQLSGENFNSNDIAAHEALIESLRSEWVE